MQATGSIDYLTMRISGYCDPAEVITSVLRLPFLLFTIGPGRYGYAGSLRCSNINVYFGGREEMGICVEMSGQGCDEYVALREDDLALLRLLRSLQDDDRVTRLDVAYDDTEGCELDFSLIAEKTQKKEVRTRLKTTTEILENNGDLGHTIYYGSKSSDYYVRIYDKAREQNQPGHWIRVEEVFRHDVAQHFVQHYLSSVDDDLPLEWQMDALVSSAAGFLLNRLAFIEITDTNVSRCNVCGWWEKFLHNPLPLTISGGVRAPEVERTAQWLRDSVMPSMMAVSLILGPDWLVETLRRGIAQNRLENSRYDVLHQAYIAAGRRPAYSTDLESETEFLNDLINSLKEQSRAEQKDDPKEKPVSNERTVKHMNNDKPNLALETRRRYLLRALTEGFRRCISDMRSAGKLLLGLLLSVIGAELWVYLAPPFVHGIIRSAQLVIAPFVLLGLLIWIGIEPGSWRMNRDLTRVGVVNEAGEAPFLIERRKTDDGQDEYIFESKGVTPTMWRDRVEEVQSALNLTIGSVKQVRDYRTVVVRAVPPNMRFGSTIMWDRKYVNFEDDSDFALGKTATGEIVHWDVEAMPHALIGGSTKSGKTRLCALILTQAVLRGAYVRIIDLKGLDYRALEAMDARVVTDKEGAVHLLRGAVEEMHRRKDLLDSAKVKSFREFNESHETPLQRQFVLVDECSALTNSGVSKEAVAISKECLDLMSTLACMGRAVGIHLIVSTQVPDVASVPTAIRSNLDLKLCGKADTILSTMILNNGSANELIPKDSQGRFAMANGSETIVFQAFYYND